MKHIWISGIKIHQIEERNPQLRNLEWIGTIPPVYSVHIFENADNTGGIVSCSDAFGGGVAWARYEGENKLIGAEMTPFDKDEIEFLQRRYPAFLEAVQTL